MKYLKSHFCLFILILFSNKLYSQSKTNFNYDNSNRVIKETYSSSCKFITYAYDQDGNRTIEMLKSFDLSTQIQNIDCNNLFGSIILNNTSPGNFTYVWSNGATGAVVTGLQTGTFTVTITESINNNVCNREFSIYNISVSGVAVINHADISCYGFSNGWAKVYIQNGTGGYVYQWSSGQTSDSIYNLAAGIYNVTVTDTVNNCVQYASVQITEPPKFITSISSTPPTCTGTNNGVAIVSVTGNPLDYNYNWSEGQTTQVADSLASGIFTVTVTSFNGCIEVDSVTVANAFPVINSINITNITCTGMQNGTATVNVIGNPNYYSFYWSDGQQTETANQLEAGTYSVTVTDSTGCMETDSILITEPLPISINYGLNNVLCNGDSSGQITLNVNGGSAPYMYSINQGLFQSNPAFTGLGTGTYDIVVKDLFNCSDSVIVLVTEPSPLNITVGTQQNATCYGQANGSISVSGSGGIAPYQFSFAGGAFGPGVIFLNIPSGTYTLQIKDSNSCIQSTLINITQPPSFITGIITDNVDCYGNATGSATAVLTGNIFSYTNISWSNGQTGINDTNLIAGTYIFYATDSTGCSLSDTIIITQPQKLIISCAPANSPCGATNGGSVTGIGTGGTPNYYFSLDNINYQTSSLFSNLTQGAYTLWIKDDHNCIDSISFGILQLYPNNGLSIGLTGDTLLTSPYSSPNIWYQTGNATPIDTSNQLICTNTGFYFVIGTDINGCSAISDTIKACTVLGLLHNEMESNISLFPNPTTGIFTLEFGGSLNGNFKLEIFDFTGRKCYQNELAVSNERKFNIDLSSFAKAIYSVNITGTQLKYYYKVSVE